MQDMDGITYDYARYQRYESAQGADQAKKTLELMSAKRTIDQWNIRGGMSLDVGCATGRYPIWLASLGFRAVGYDKSEEAIRICNDRARNNVFRSRLTFSTQDIVTCELPAEHFVLITSMMGTFNHLGVSCHHDILTKYYNSLAQGGGLILSCWNPLCMYLDFLSLYGASERQFLLNNSIACATLVDLVKDIGYKTVDWEYYSALPDVCYDSWNTHITDGELSEIDSYLITRNGLGQFSQMYLLVARKP
jgi:SAM-dependent methyltransferase